MYNSGTVLSSNTTFFEIMAFGFASKKNEHKSLQLLIFFQINIAYINVEKIMLNTWYKIETEAEENLLHTACQNYKQEEAHINGS